MLENLPKDPLKALSFIERAQKLFHPMFHYVLGLKISFASSTSTGKNLELF
jgi:hypothetical protein